MMKATLFVLFVGLLMVGCGEESQSAGSEGEVERGRSSPGKPDWTIKEDGILDLIDDLNELTKRRAEGGDKIAQYNLGNIYYIGDGVPQDRKEAVKWFRLAAEQGYALAQFNLGGMYYNGEEVPQDFKEALSWYSKSAEQGDADSQAMVGVFYADGLGVAKNSIEGYAWWYIAIANESEKAKEWIKEIELSPEQLIEAKKLAKDIHRRIESNRKD